MTEPLLTNERAKREWTWLVERFGTEVCQAAIQGLPGGRRPYPLNVARQLGIQLPEDLTTAPTPPTEARQHIESIKALLKPARTDQPR